MGQELILRFFAGGIVVSLFALLGEVVKPRSFAGIFAAAPSVAIATCALTAAKAPRAELALSARSMTVAAFALAACTVACVTLLRRSRVPVRVVALAGWAVWGVIAALCWACWLRVAS